MFDPIPDSEGYRLELAETKRRVIALLRFLAWWGAIALLAGAILAFAFRAA